MERRDAPATFVSSEGDTWRRLRRRVGDRWLAFRVENVALPGTPDVCFKVGDRWGWLELKHRATMPRRLTRRTLRVTPQQALFNRTYGSWLLAHVADRWLLFDDLGAAEGELRSVAGWFDPEFDVAEFIKIITR